MVLWKLGLFVFISLVSSCYDPTKPSEKAMTQKDISSFTNKWSSAVAYSGFRNGQSPITGVYPTKEEIREDLLILGKNWKYIRLYGSDIQAERTLAVIKERGIPLKVFLGIWISQDMEGSERQIQECIRLANLYPDIVAAVVVGNEALFEQSDHQINVSRMINYVHEVRDSVSQPVSVADLHSFWEGERGRDLADELDFIIIHIYALWEYQTIDNAVAYSKNIYKKISAKYPDKCIVIGETGWASRAVNRYMASGQGSDANQRRFYQESMNWVSNANILTFYFEAFDEDWKSSSSSYSPDDPERHWGFFTTNRKAKPVIYDAYPELVDPSYKPLEN